VVPYGDPEPPGFFRNAFDEGEDGIGRFANSLSPHRLPQQRNFFQRGFSRRQWGPTETLGHCSLRERRGLLWKHSFEEGNESRRARELVLAWIATVGNYEYVHWVFQPDGAWKWSIADGIMQVKGVKVTLSPKWSTVAEAMDTWLGKT